MKRLFRLSFVAAICGVAVFSCKEEKDKEVTLESIAVTTQPVKKNYTVGETFDHTGMVVTATYSDNSTKPVTITSSMLEYDFSTVGTGKIVIITYEGKKAEVLGITVSQVVLSGTVSVTGNAVFGETLIANTESLTSTPTIPSLGTLLYQWQRGTAVIVGATSSTYTLVQDDIGNTINIVVSAANCSGSIRSGNTAAVAKAAQTAPVVPSIASATSTSITLTAIAGGEYSRNGGAFQTLPEFTGLTEGTAYTFVQRFAETATHQASPTSAAASFSTTQALPEDGTEEYPYRISTASQLANLAAEVNGGSNKVGIYYKLTENIILAGTWTPIGTEANPFKGKFDGNGKIISGLTISTNSDNIGLFGYVVGGTITNLGLANVNIYGGSVTGGVTGIIEGSGSSIIGCYVTGTVIGHNLVGGVAGFVDNGNVINNCYTTCSVSGDGYVGGIAGENYGTVNNCYATGAISGSTGNCGGIVGTNFGTLSNCVGLNPSITRTSGSERDFGRVAGYNGGTLTNNAAFSGMTTNSGVNFGNGETEHGIGITATQSKTQSTYTSRNWDFTSSTAPWKWTVDTYQLPVFHWQNSAPSALPTHLN